MKQVVQNYRDGSLSIEDVPAPLCRAGGVLVRTAWSLVSTGTERMKDAYRHAVAAGYRFYSYGDCCFLQRSANP